jgi:prophage antirepressor-like protein
MTREIDAFKERYTGVPATFTFEAHEVRTIFRNNEIWFVATDVCKVLGLTNPSQSLSRLDPDAKGIISNETPGGQQEMTVVNEFGLYMLVFSSRKAKARIFTRWVTHEVLPSIRKTGRYDTVEQEKSSTKQFNPNEITVYLPAPGDYHVTVKQDHSYILTDPLPDAIAFPHQTADLHLVGSAIITIAALWLQSRLEYPPLTNGEYPHLRALDQAIVAAKALAYKCMEKSKI